MSEEESLGYTNTDKGFHSESDRLKNRLSNMSSEEKRKAVLRIKEFCDGKNRS